MDRRLPDLTDSLEWNLTHRGEYQATENGDGTYTPIPPLSFIISNSNTLMIGVKSVMAASNWYTGGWAAQRLLMVPSSTTEFTANIQTNSIRLRLGVLNLCQFPALVPTWMLYLKIPKWIKQAIVEVWRYEGRELQPLQSAEIVRFVVPASLSSVLLLSARDDRVGAIIVNNSPARLYLDLAATASQSAYTAIIESAGYYELPYGYTGAVAGVWAAANGEAQITEFL